MFENVAIFQVREKRLESEVNQALAGLAGRNGKGGATIEVLMPTLKGALPDTAGPDLHAGAKVPGQGTALGQPGCQRDRVECGTNRGQHRADVPIVFSGRGDAGILRRADLLPLPSGAEAPVVLVRVTLQATFALTALARTAAPGASAAGESVTLTDKQPGGGSVIYYTTDGSFPGAGNPKAQVYSGPFTVEGGTMVRTAAYNGSLQGSMVDTFTVN